MTTIRSVEMSLERSWRSLGGMMHLAGCNVKPNRLFDHLPLSAALNTVVVKQFFCSEISTITVALVTDLFCENC